MIPLPTRIDCREIRDALIRLLWIAALVVGLALPNRIAAEEPSSLSTDIGWASEMSEPGAERSRPSDWQWQIRPKGFVYDTYWASAQEPRLSTQWIDEAGSGSLMDSTIGGRLALLRYGPHDRTDGLQLDIAAAAALRQDADNNLDVVSTDFRFTLPLSYGVGPHRFKFGYYHVSAHTGDEFLLSNPTHVRLNFSRDALVLGYSYYPTPTLRLYAEAGWAFASEFSEPWDFQFGLDYGPTRPTGIRGAPFFAINGHLREEQDFGGNLALQTGLAWRGEDPNDGILRTGLYYYNGASPQFSFFRQHEEQIGWGLWYDF